MTSIGFAWLAGIVGLIIGSFLNVVIIRYPRILSSQWERECHDFLELTTAKPKPVPYTLLTPGSHCPHCEKTIPGRYNIPLIGYFLAKGRCANCKKHISLRYPVIEVLSGILSFVLALHFGWGSSAFMAIILTYILIVLFFIDLDHQFLPDTITLSTLWIGLIWNVTAFHWTTPSQAIVGAFVGYFILWLLNKGYVLLRGQEGMGYGDFKMSAMLGAFFGVAGIIQILILATILGGLTGIVLMLWRRADLKTAVSFGPFIAVVGLATLLVGVTGIGHLFHFPLPH
ncbi:MAG: hypothetical protein A3J38_07755 [Gammaproteobacteria bacterium RIFCSPHIGHO2_12_FULL_45_9]|nr:MAG: hypothetical protein A3J38_07755 [Gammaproteobacteria bacterium RIFCSPHIGHO2_12_FULL_45_9]